jgi:hypothetical protein
MRDFVFRQSENFGDGAGILKVIGLVIFKFSGLKKNVRARKIFPGKFLKTIPEFFPAKKFSENFLREDFHSPDFFSSNYEIFGPDYSGSGIFV